MPELKSAGDPYIPNFSGNERPDCTGSLKTTWWIRISHEDLKMDSFVSRHIAQSQLGKAAVYCLAALVSRSNVEYRPVCEQLCHRRLDLRLGMLSHWRRHVGRNVDLKA